MLSLLLHRARRKDRRRENQRHEHNLRDREHVVAVSSTRQDVAELVVVTVGQAGAIAKAPQGEDFSAPTLLIRVHQVQGAGAAFSAALIHARSEEQSIAETIRFACQAGKPLVRPEPPAGSSMTADVMPTAEQSRSGMSAVAVLAGFHRSPSSTRAETTLVPRAAAAGNPCRSRGREDRSPDPHRYRCPCTPGSSGRHRRRSLSSRSPGNPDTSASARCTPRPAHAGICLEAPRDQGSSSIRCSNCRCPRQ